MEPRRCRSLGLVPASRNPIAVSIAQLDQFGAVGGTSQGSDPFPLRVGSSKYRICRSRRGDEPVECSLVFPCPVCGYDITGQRQVRGNAECRKGVADREEGPHAMRLELGGKRPKGQ